MKTINKKNSKFLINNSSFLKLIFIFIALVSSIEVKAQWTDIGLNAIQTPKSDVVINYAATQQTSSSITLGLLAMPFDSKNIKIKNENGDFYLLFNNTPRFTINKNGFVGIGETPTHRLTVAGRVRAEQAVIGNKAGGFAFFGNSNLDQLDNNFQNYALMQGPLGGTYLNAADNTSLYLRINNNDKLVVQQNKSTFENVLKVESAGGIYNPGGYHYLAGGTVLGAYKPINGATLSVDGRVYISENGGTERGFTNYTSDNYKDYLLWVEKGIAATDVAVTKLVHWPDYVFNADYKLTTLNEIDAFIKQNGHLPSMPSAKEVEENGFTITDMTKRTVKTVEELTLHAIEQQKLTLEQQKLIQSQAKMIELLEKRLNTLESKL